MAAIHVGGGDARKAVDHEIPLVPFIDLLLCCVMFLLATAVWAQLGAMNADQRRAPGAEDGTDDPPGARLILQIQREGFVLASTAGDRVEIPNAGSEYDVAGLARRLAQQHQLTPDEEHMLVAPDDGVPFENVVRAMDVLYGAGFSDLTMSDGMVR